MLSLKAVREDLSLAFLLVSGVAGNLQLLLPSSEFSVYLWPLIRTPVIMT